MSKRAAVSYARQSLTSWRATGEITETTRQLHASWLYDDAVARQWLASWRAAGKQPLILSLALLCSFFSFVASLGLHQASNTCPPLPTQARKRVEEFLCLTYTIIKLQISHK